MRITKKFSEYNDVLYFLDEAERVYNFIKQPYTSEVGIMNDEGWFKYVVTIFLYEST